MTTNRTCSFCDKEWTHVALMESDAEKPSYTEFICDDHISVIKHTCIDFWTKEEYETDPNDSIESLVK